jgi:hypothetical protein
MIIYIFIHIYYLTLPLGNHLSYILKQKILVPSSVLTAVGPHFACEELSQLHQAIPAFYHWSVL